MLAVHKSLSCIRRKDLETTTAEVLWVQITLDKTRKAYVGTVYLPKPNERVLTALEESMVKVNAAAKFNDKIIMLGDFNLPDISYRTSADYEHAIIENRHELCPVSSHFVEIMDGNGLFQYNTVPTTEPHRDRSIRNNHILDLFIGNELDDVKIDLVEKATSSTHYALDITVKLNAVPVDVPPNRIVHNYRKADWTHIYTLLSYIFWSDFASFPSVNAAYEHFYDVLNAVIKECVPTFNVSGNKFPHWYSKDLIATIKHKEKQRCIFLKSGRDTTSDAYMQCCQLRRDIKRMQKHCWKEYVTQLECNINNCPKRFWSHVKSRRKSSSLPLSMTYKNVLYTTSDAIAKAFSFFFKSIFNQYDFTNMPHSIVVNCPIFSMPLITSHEVRNILRSLDSSTSSGYDNISAKFLIQCADVLCEPISNLYNLSIINGEYPDVLKRDNVVPIFKRKGSKTAVENYRGIAIQPILAKVFEGFVNRALRSHLSNLIVDNQHGFMKSKSCATNLITYSDFITKTFDNKTQTHSIYTDFRRAFDVVPHKLLLHKLNKQFGVEGTMLKWFKSYLSGRMQRVVINGVSSNWYSASSGVPQGSIIGPTLFLTYINDIANCVKYSQFLLFADDTKLFKEIKTFGDCLLLQNDIDNIFAWCKTWCMELNTDKCYFMNFTIKRANDIVYDYFIGDTLLKRTYEMKDLGIYFTPNLNFSVHINYICRKSFQMIGFLKRVTHDFTNQKTFFTLYNSYIRSRLEYCSQVWSPSSAVHIAKLERVQKRFLKYVCFKNKIMYDHYDYPSLCSMFNLKSLESRRKISDLCFFNKIMTNNINCPYIVGEIPLNVPSRTLRYKPTFNIQFRLQCRRDSFLLRVMEMANRLDLYDTLVMNEPVVFKRFIKDFIT